MSFRFNRINKFAIPLYLSDIAFGFDCQFSGLLPVRYLTGSRVTSDHSLFMLTNDSALDVKCITSQITAVVFLEEINGIMVEI